MSKFPDKGWCEGIHKRILSDDPVAPAELCKAMIGPLRGWLYMKGRTTVDDLIKDAATDALVDYLRRPTAWKAEKGTLVSYLCMAADRDLLTSTKRLALRKGREILSDDVEDVQLPGNEDQEEEESPLPLAPAKLLARLARQIPKEADRKVLQMMLDGERSTERFAKVLEIQHLPKREKADEVKRIKDRLKKVVERLGSKIGD